MTAQSIPAARQESDCSSPILLFLLWIWLVLVAFVRIFSGVYESAFVGQYSQTYLAGQVLVQVFLTVPPLLLVRRWRNQRYQAVFQTWLAAALYPLFLLPVQFIRTTDMQLQDLAQILLSLVYAFIIYRYFSRPNWKGEREAGDRGVSLSPASLSPELNHFLLTTVYLLAFLISGVFAWPWLAWGAPGSVLDTLLGLLTGLAFGVAAAVVLARLYGEVRENPGSFLLFSFGSGTALFLFASGLGFSFDGMQALLMVGLASLGGVVTGILLRAGSPRARDLLAPLALLVGLCATAPLILIDPDELALIISDTLGEILFWAIRAAVASFVVGSAASLVISLLTPRNPVRPARPTGDRKPVLLLAGTVLAWIGAAAIFFFIGQPGFYGEGLFVILKDQADVKTLAAQQPDPSARRALVYHSLVDHANSTQAPLRQVLERFRIAYTPYYLENAMQVQGGPLVRFWLEQQPQVDRVLDNPWLRPLPEPLPTTAGSGSQPTAVLWNQTMIGADRVWNELHVTGKGVVIGQSDSGVQWDHPELKDSYRGWDTATGQVDHNYNWYDPWYGRAAPADIGGHGTHTLGSALGDHVGIAPDASWYACANLARNLGNPALYLDCMQFMLAPFPLNGSPFQDGDPGRGANVINNSWGCPDMEGCDPNSLKEAVDALRAAGVFVVASAGNDGPACDTVKDPPALYAASISVGAIDSSGQLTDFSSLGPVTADGSDRVKPDIVAPGAEVFSSMPENSYDVLSGTSMSGPHVVGVVALMWSANPGLIGDIDRTEQILLQAAKPYKGPLPQCPGVNAHPSTAVGYGIVDAYQAVKMAMEVK